MTEKTLDLGVIEVWHGVLQDALVLNRNYWSILSDSERANAEQRRSPEMQNRYAAIHAQKRLILARYLNCSPESVAIAIAKHGKPYLPDHRDWTFNLSHSGDHYAIAVARNCRLGLDIESPRSRTNLSGLVGKCFAPHEIAYWRALPEHEHIAAFYRFWTRKEAFVKATGRGIALGLDRCVTDPDDPVRMLSVPDDFGPASAWRLFGIELDDGVCGAVAADRDFKTLQLRKIV